MAKKRARRETKNRKVERGRTTESAPTKPGRFVTPARAEAESLPTIVAVGASAGGLEALTQVLEQLPQRPNIAIVFVQHLSPEHSSALAELLSLRTSMMVVQAANGMSIEPNHLYVIPPNAHMDVTDGRLHLLPRPLDRTQ